MNCKLKERVLPGRIHVGLTPAQLEYLADTDTNSDTVKISRRDLAPAMTLKKNGGTTIAGTMIIAHLAGIKVFATGGLGGVHRNGENSKKLAGHPSAGPKDN